jgi:hypothetical protein
MRRELAGLVAAAPSHPLSFSITPHPHERPPRSRDIETNDKRTSAVYFCEQKAKGVPFESHIEI